MNAGTFVMIVVLCIALTPIIGIVFYNMLALTYKNNICLYSIFSFF